MGKNVLVVEDDMETKEFYETKLGANHNITFMFYEKGSFQAPVDKFDVLIVDGLCGDYMDIVSKVNADKKILVSGDDDCREEATEAGLVSIAKNADVLDKIMRELR